MFKHRRLQIALLSLLLTVIILSMSNYFFLLQSKHRRYYFTKLVTHLSSLSTRRNETYSWLSKLSGRSVYSTIARPNYYYSSVSEEPKPISMTLKSGILETANTPTQYALLKDYIPPETNLSDKYIIYRCNSNRQCGGLADRQMGMITSYLISQILRRKFGIIMRKGCDFSNYIVPNDVKWIVSESELNRKSSDVKHLINNNTMKRIIGDTDLETMFDKDVTYYEGNINYVKALRYQKSAKSLEWVRNKSTQDIYRTAFAQLFKFAPNTLHRYRDFHARTKHSPLTCAHLRMGKSATISKDDDLTHRRPSPEVLIQFLKTNLTLSPSEKLFIATDSEEVGQQMKSAFPDSYVELDGPIVHVDRYVGHYNCTGLEKAILDQFILSTCGTLIVSNSGFSRIAAYLRGTDDKLYLAGTQAVKKTTRSRV